MLAGQAYNEGLIHVERDDQLPWRNDVSEMIRSRQEEIKQSTGADIPLVCLNITTLHQLEKLSLLVEGKLFLFGTRNHVLGLNGGKFLIDPQTYCWVQ